MEALFREEALRSFETAPWQPPLLSAPVSGFLLLALVASAAAAIFGFAASFEFARAEQVQGHLAPAAGWTRVAATSFGVVGRLRVVAGDRVEAGDVLLDLAPTEGLQKGLTVQAKLLEEIEAQRGILESQERLLRKRHQNNLRRLHRENALADEELAAITREIGLHRDRLAIAEGRLADGQRLFAAGALAATGVRDLRDNVRALAVPLAEKQRIASGIRSLLTGIEERRDRLAVDLEADRALVHERLHELAMEEYRTRAEGSARVLAPRTGVVASVGVRTGDRVVPGRRLLDILPPDTALRARVYVPSSAMAHVAVGNRVRVYLDAFPYEHHGAQLGRVISVSDSTLAADEGLGKLMGTPSFQVDVDFPNGFDLAPEQRSTLRPGMTVSVDFVGVRGTLLDWALEPLRGTAERA